MQNELTKLQNSPLPKKPHQAKNNSQTHQIHK